MIVLKLLNPAAEATTADQGTATTTLTRKQLAQLILFILLTNQSSSARVSSLAIFLVSSVCIYS